MAARNPETSTPGGFPDSSFKYNPLQHVRVMFIRFCQGLFHSAPEGAYHWKAKDGDYLEEDEQATEISISNENKLDPETLMRRPAISFTRGPVQFYSLGIDDLIKYELDIQKKTKGVLVPGTMMINCVSRSELESEHIAWVVSEHIWLLRDLLMKAGFFDIGRAPQIGSPSPAGSIVSNDQGDEFVVTTVSVPYQFSRTSSLTPLGQRVVQGIEQRLSLRPSSQYSDAPGSQAVGSRGAAQAGHEYPMNIHACPPPSFAPGAEGVYNQSPRPGPRRQPFLPKQRHPLDPSVTVRVRTVRPNMHGIAPLRRGSVAVPISDPCVEQS